MTEAERLVMLLNADKTDEHKEQRKKETEAQKMRKYGLAAEIKRRYEELLRIQERYTAEANKIRASKDYSAEGKQRKIEKIKQDRLAEQQRVYEAVEKAIQQLAKEVQENRPAEAFDFGSPKFTNALKLIEMGGKALSPSSQMTIIQQFRYCPEALTALEPIMEVAGMKDGVSAIEDLRKRATYEERYPNMLEDSFYFACRDTENCMNIGGGLYQEVQRVDDFVRSSDVFNRDVGRAVNPAAEELKSIEPTETQPDAKPETAAEPKVDIFNPGEMTDEEWFAYRKSIASQG